MGNTYSSDHGVTIDECLRQGKAFGCCKANWCTPALIYGDTVDAVVNINACRALRGKGSLHLVMYLAREKRHRASHPLPELK